MNFFSILQFSINAVLPLILIILIGFFLKKKGLITGEFIKIGNKVVFKLCLPVLLFSNVASIATISDINFNIIIYVLAVIFLLFILGFILVRFVQDNRQKGVMLQCVFRSNFALIGIPLSELIGGAKGIQVAAIISVVSIPVYNILAVIVLSSYVNKDGNTNSFEMIKKQFKAIAKNPLIIGVLLGLLVLVIKNLIPDNVVTIYNENFAFITKSIDYISRSATPLALLVLGGQFEFEKIEGYKKQIITATFARTIIAPAIGIGIAAVLQFASILQFDPAVYATFIALFGTPVAVSSAIMAEAMDNDGQLATQLVVWTSVASLFTLFLLIFVCRMIGLI